MEIKLHSPSEIKAKIGSEIGVSQWISIDQDMINRFADLTDDHQFIHVDPERAAQTPFGGTIAHGFLVLSMLASMGKAASFSMRGVYMGVNYGFDKIRIMAPVRSGKRIRGRFILKDMTERTPGQWMASLDCTIEIEGETKPAVKAEWLSLQFVNSQEA
jgi:acyl dehydratase